MNIAIVSDAIYPYNKGGKEKRIFEISTRLVKRGHKVTIYCMKWWKGKENVKKENGVILHAISPLYPLYSGDKRSIKQAVMFALSCFKLINIDFDIIDIDHMPHLVLFPLKIVCLIKRKKMIVTWNEVWGRKYWVEYMGILGNIAYVIEKLSSLLPDKIISISEHTKEKLMRDLSSEKEITTISIGLNNEEIQKVKPSKIKSDIIFAGRLLKHKNVNILIDVIKILSGKNSDISCIIVGEGPEKQNLIKQVTSLDLKKNIKFLDFILHHKNLYSLMKSSKIFVLPSTREGFGIVVIEANACGIPVITTNHIDNAARDLIKDGKNGFSVNPDKDVIAEKAFHYLNAKSFKNTYSSSANQYDWDNIIKKVENAYHE